MPPVNELLPEDPQYEYSSPMSLLPVRRKLVPYAPGKAPLELAVPGFARSILNDLYLAFTAPGNALGGQYTPEEIPEIGMRAGAGLAMAGAGVPAQRLAFGSFALKPNPWNPGPSNPYTKFWDIFSKTNDKLINDHGVGLKIADDTAGLHPDMKFKLVDSDGKDLPHSDVLKLPEDALNALEELGSAKNELPPLKEVPAAEPKLSAWGEAYKYFQNSKLSLSGDAEYLYDEARNPVKSHQLTEKGQALWAKAYDEAQAQKKPPMYSDEDFEETVSDPFKQMPWEPEDHLAAKPPDYISPAPKYNPGLGAYVPANAKPKLANHPLSAMREYSPSELDWEYGTEYEKYTKPIAGFEDAFKDRADFQRKYDAAPLRHLTARQLENLDYGTVGPVIRAKPGVDKMSMVRDMIGTRRDVEGIRKGIESGTTAPPIVLIHENGLRLLGGNTRLMTGVALGKSIPVKMIDLRKYPLRGSDRFDTAEPVSGTIRSENFKKWFGDSKAVDENGKPLVLYHASGHQNIEAFDPEYIHKKTEGERDFVSLTTDPKFASNWKEGAAEQTIYPVHVRVENPADFRNPEDVKKAIDWYGERYRARKKADYEDNPSYLNEIVTNYKSGLVDSAKKGLWSFWEEPRMWKDLGWDGTWMKEYGGPNDPINLAVPKPSQIKSVFNKGTYSETDPRISHMGGTAASGLAGALLGVEPVDHNPWDLEPVSHDPFAQEGEQKPAPQLHDAPMDSWKEGLEELESNNYDVLRSKGYSPEESRFMSTNPSGRLGPPQFNRDKSLDKKYNDLYKKLHHGAKK